MPEPLLRHAPTHLSGRSAATARSRTVTCAQGPVDGSALAALLDHLRRRGHTLSVTGPRPTGTDATTLDPAPTGAPPADEVATTASRHIEVEQVDPRHDRPTATLTLAFVEPRDLLDPDLDLPGLAARAAATIVPSRAAWELLDAAGHPVHLLPPLLTTAEMVALQRIRVPRAAPVVGWIVGDDDGRYPAHLGAITPAMRAVLEHEGARLEVTGASGALPLDMRKDERVTIFEGRPEPVRLARWTCQVWSPPDDCTRSTGDVRQLVAASHAGVPTVLAGVDAAAVGVLALPELTVARSRDADTWTSTVESLLDPAVRDERSDRSRALADALAGQWAAEVVVNRLLGWIDRLVAP